MHPARLMRLHYNDPSLYQTGTDGDDRPEYIYRPAGRFRFGTGTTVPTGGNPLVSGDEGRWIAGRVVPAPGFDLTSFTNKLTVSVDGRRVDPYIMQYNQDDTADIGELPLFWPGGVAVGSRDVMGTQLIPLLSEVPTEGEPNLRVRHRWMMVHDGLMLEKIIHNDDTVSRNVGLRILVDTSFGAETFDGQPIVLDDGTQITTETVLPDAERGLSLPDTWVTYDHPETPRIGVRGTLDASEVRRSGIASESAGRPDLIGFGQFRTMGMDAQWDWTPDPQTPITNENWAYMVRWNERSLRPGHSRRYVTYIGLGAASVDYDPPFGFGVYSPSRLEVREGADPATPEDEPFHFAEPGADSVFTVSAGIDHFGDTPLTQATARISLPAGFELHPDTQPRSVTLGRIVRNQSPLPMAQWTVRAVDPRPGSAEIRVHGPMGKVLTRSINVPAIPMLPPRESRLGLEMLSIPYRFTNSDAAHVFGSLTDSLFPGGPVTLWRWRPDRERYVTYPDTFAAHVELGRGQWLLNQNRETIVLPDDAREARLDESFILPIQPGWNQIGNPHVVPNRFDQIRVQSPDGAEFSIREAARQGLILPVLYAYDPAANEYTWETSLADASVVPYEGYWLLAFREVSLLFPPPAVTAPAAEPRPAAATEDDGWRVGLVVERGDTTRLPRYFAMSADSGEETDMLDVPAPPSAMSAGPVLDAFFTLPEDERGMRYLMDTRSDTSQRQVWDFTVVSEAAGERVTVRWPELSANLPDDLVATLEDTATEKRLHMRTSESYSFVPSAGGERQLKVVVRPRAEAILALNASTRTTADGSGLEIVYSLASDAVVDVEVRNIAGRVVRHVATERTAPAGQNTLTWNGLSDTGTRAPAGRYIVQITARSPETGEKMSVIRTATVGR